jgi:LacI family transcriptional regulator
MELVLRGGEGNGDSRVRASLKDIARRAGVSATTASLAFVKGSRISDPTRKKILTIARRLHYLPNQAARSLRLGASNMVGFLVNDIENPFYAHMVRLAEAILALSGYQVIMAESNWDPRKEVDAVRNLIQAQVRGILMCSCEETDEGFRLVEQYTIPCIAVDTFPSFYAGAYVKNNLAKAGHLAADALIDAGSRRLAVMSGKPAMRRYSAFVQMEQAFGERCRERGIRFQKSSIVRGGLTVDDGERAFTRFSSSHPDIDGVFCFNDLCAIGVIEAVEKSGLEVGKDVAVVGVDNLDISGMRRISLSSIREPNDAIVELAATELAKCIKTGRKPTIRAVRDPVLIQRGSTAARGKSTTPD